MAYGYPVKHRMRAHHIKAKYGLSIEQYEKMVWDREGRCDICGEEPAPVSDGRLSLVVDHSHESGEVRGLLCLWCNTGIGQFRDSAGRLQSAIDYLSKNQS